MARLRYGSVLLVVAAFGCAPDFQGTLRCTIECDRDEAFVGEGFHVRVLREWPRELAPQKWEAQALAPLSAEEISVERHAGADSMVEVRTLRVHAFEAGPLTIPGPVLRARDKATGQLFDARSKDLHLQLHSGLAPGDAGALEAPFARRPGTGIGDWALWVAAFLTGAALWLWWAGRPRAAVQVSEPPEDQKAAAPDLRALLKALNSLDPNDPASLRRAYESLSDVLRLGLGIELEGGSEAWTLQDWRRAWEARSSEAPAHLDLLQDCDHSRFSAHAGSLARWSDHLARAQALLRAQANTEEPAS